MGWLHEDGTARVGRLAGMVLCVAPALAWAAGSEGTRPLARQVGAIYSLAAYPAALCNDGTPGVYYFRPGAKGSTRWVFYLEGGKECNSNQSCASERNKSPLFTSSTGWTLTPTGIMSTSRTSNPDFYNANEVQVHYCSSDYWSGAKVATAAFTASNADSGWSFQGRAIAVAALQDLMARNASTNFAAATDVLLSGSSGGALGIVYTINDMLPSVPAGARKLLAVDAGFDEAINAFDPNNPPTYMTTTDPIATIIANGIALWNGHGDTGCAGTATTTQAKITCYDTSVLLNGTYITIPAFITQSQLDTDQLGQHNWKGSTVNSDAAHLQYATEFADGMKALLQATAPINTVFSPQRLSHTMISTTPELTYQEQFGSVTMTPSAAMSAWYAAPSPATQIYGNAAGLP